MFEDCLALSFYRKQSWLCIALMYNRNGHFQVSINIQWVHANYSGHIKNILSNFSTPINRHLPMKNREISFQKRSWKIMLKLIVVHNPHDSFFSFLELENFKITSQLNHHCLLLGSTIQVSWTG